MHPTKDMIYQRCIIGAAQQNYNAPNMHQTLLSLLKATATTGGFNRKHRWVAPGAQICTKMPQMAKNGPDWPKNDPNWPTMAQK